MDNILDKDILANNLDNTIQRIEKARIAVNEHHIVKMVVVGKYTALENIETLYSLGQRAFGENQVQQLQERSQKLEDLPIEWHMIGRLQKNKINKLIETNPFLLQSLDSLDLAQELDKRLKVKSKKMRCLLQINSSNEDTKTGVEPQRAIDIYQEIDERFNNIELQGVMSIGANSKDKKVVRQSFETTRKIFEELKNSNATICSMGMSSDFELAIECGSNMVRIGSALFKDA